MLNRPVVTLAAAGLLAATAVGVAAILTEPVDTAGPGNVIVSRETTAWPMSPAVLAGPNNHTARASVTPGRHGAIGIPRPTAPTKPSQLIVTWTPSTSPTGTPAVPVAHLPGSGGRTADGLPIVYTTPPADGRCGEGGVRGIQYICTGIYQLPPAIPPVPDGHPCADDASQCLNALDPGDPNDISGLFGG